MWKFHQCVHEHTVRSKETAVSKEPQCNRVVCSQCTVCLVSRCKDTEEKGSPEMREPIHSLSSPPSCGTGHCLGTFKKDRFSSWVCSSDSTQLISRDLQPEKNLFFVDNIHKVTVFRMLPKVPPGFIHTGSILATSQRKGVPIPRQ